MRCALRWFIIFPAACGLPFGCSRAEEPKTPPPGTVKAGTDRPPVAATPAPRDAKWVRYHEALVEAAKQSQAEVVFIGDSITDFWRSAGRRPWEQRLAPFRPLNLGIAGDRTEHVLWRLQNGALGNLKPRAVVLMIGTNNLKGVSAAHSVEDTAAGVAAILKELDRRLPGVPILLLSILPRQPKYDWMAAKVKETNAKLEALGDGRRVRFLNLHDRFLDAEGGIRAELMEADLLHLSEKGYETWAEAITPVLKEWVGAEPPAAKKSE